MAVGASLLVIADHVSSLLDRKLNKDMILNKDSGYTHFTIFEILLILVIYLIVKKYRTSNRRSN